MVEGIETSCFEIEIYTVKPLLRGHLWDKEKVVTS
jgi:hypothetical protein